MGMFTFKKLYDAYKSFVINQTQFLAKLREYVECVYNEALNNPEICKSLISAGNKIYYDFLDSITERISLASQGDPNDFYMATNIHNNFNELDQIDEEAYEVFHCYETKVNLGTIDKNRKKITISIGLESGTIYVNILSKRNSDL